ncbi:MAG: cytochrome b/b6 domain-containing protein [Bacteroidota bacterium]
MKEYYSKRTVWLHWLSSILIFVLIGTGIYMEGLSVGTSKFLLYRVHFASGALVFLLTLVRLLALLKDKRPNSLYQRGTAMWYLLEGVHYGFYLVIMWMCISGMLSLSLEGILPALQSGALADLPEIISDGFHPIMLSHHIIAKLVLLLLIAHIGGVILYYFRYKQNTLKRTWFQ